MRKELKAAIESVSAFGLPKFASRLMWMVPRKGAKDRAEKLAMMRAAVEAAAAVLDETAPQRGDQFDLVRIDLMQAIESEGFEGGR